MPSTRNNQRSIDHFFISDELVHHVTQAGILPNEVGFTSDHAGLFIDVATAILETKNYPIPPAKQRKLKYYNSPNVQKYINYVLEQFESHNIGRRIQKLQK